MQDNRLEMSRELEEMRQQFAIMKERFDRQEIVTDRLLRETQKRRINIYDWLNLYIPMIVLPAMMPLLYLCWESYGLPLWVAITAAAIASLCVAVHYYERRRYMKTFNFEGDVQEIAEFVRAFRMRTFKMKVIGSVISVMFLITGCAVWLPDVQLTDDPLRWILCILLALAVAVISIVIEVKSIRLLDNIIRDLEQ